MGVYVGDRTPLSYTPDVLIKQPIICELFQMVEIGNINTSRSITVTRVTISLLCH